MSGAAFYYPQCWPHLCAGFLARGRLWWINNKMLDESMALLRHVPGFFVVGLNDKAERIEGFRTAETYFKDQGFEGVFHFRKGYGHEWIPELNEDGFNFLLNRKRIKKLNSRNGSRHTLS